MRGNGFTLFQLPSQIEHSIDKVLFKLRITYQLLELINLANICFSDSTWTRFWHHKYGNCYIFNRGRDNHNRKTEVKTSSIPGHEGGKWFVRRVFEKLSVCYTSYWSYTMFTCHVQWISETGNNTNVFAKSRKNEKAAKERAQKRNRTHPRNLSQTIFRQNLRYKNPIFGLMIHCSSKSS